jgi:hypothetical protein
MIEVTNITYRCDCLAYCRNTNDELWGLDYAATPKFDVGRGTFLRAAYGNGSDHLPGLLRGALIL